MNHMNVFELRDKLNLYRLDIIDYLACDHTVTFNISGKLGFFCVENLYL